MRRVLRKHSSVPEVSTSGETGGPGGQALNAQGFGFTWFHGGFTLRIAYLRALEAFSRHFTLVSHRCLYVDLRCLWGPNLKSQQIT